MAHTFISGEFLGSTTLERVAMCRKLAAEAGHQADDASNPQTKRAYLDLKMHWETLAGEIEAMLASDTDGKMT